MNKKISITTKPPYTFVFVLLLFLIFSPITNISYAQDSTQVNLLKYQIQKKNPWFPLCLSVAIPGLGQAYNNDYKKSVCFLGAAVICGVIGSYEKEEVKHVFIYGADLSYTEIKTPYDDLGFALFLTTIVWSSIDAYRTVTKRNNELKKKYNIDFSLSKIEFILL